jgi:hypothetical protein
MASILIKEVFYVFLRACSSQHQFYFTFFVNYGIVKI